MSGGDTRNEYKLPDGSPSSGLPYDILLQGVDNESLTSDVSKRLGVEYLGNAPLASYRPKEPVLGTIYHHTKRLILPIPVSSRLKPAPCYVHFLIDTGSPTTFLSAEVRDSMCTENFC